MMDILKLLLGVASFGAIASARASMPPRYVITEIQGLGGNESIAAQINNAGVTVGTTGYDSFDRAFRATGTGIANAQDLGLPSGYETLSNVEGALINNNGQIVVEAIKANDVIHGIARFRTFVIPAGGTLAVATDIGTLGGDFAHAWGMNESGQVVGDSRIASTGPWHAYRYTPGFGIVDIAGSIATYSYAYDINNFGQVVGKYVTLNGSAAYRTLPNGNVRPEDNLGSFGGAYTTAKLINDTGQVAGMSETPGSGSHLFRTKPNQAINAATDDLGALPGSRFAEPFGLNNAGDVVGWSQLPSRAYHAIVAFGDSNALYDLNDLIDERGSWVFDIASSINDNGVIIARAAYNGSGTSHAFMLVPIPEPSGTATLLAILPAIIRCQGRKRSGSLLINNQ